MDIINPNRTCPGCGIAFVAHHGRQVFHDAPCKAAFDHLNKMRGSIAIPLLQSWRRGRHKAHAEEGKFAFNQLCALADAWNEADKASGRRPDVIVRKRIDQGWAAADA